MTLPREYSDREITEGLLAAVAWGGKLKHAAGYLAKKGFDIPLATLYEWVQFEHVARYDKLRAEHGPELEAKLVAELREQSYELKGTIGLAVKKARKRLKDNKDPDPARTAANLASVLDKTNRTMLLLDGRPTSIKKDDGDPLVHVRALMAMGVIELTGTKVSELSEATEAEPADADEGIGE